MKLLSLLLLSLAIVACAPPYSAELNSAAPLARQMTLLGTLGPVNSPEGDSTTSSIKFLPTKPPSTATTIAQLNVGSGFLVSRTPGRESLSFATQSSGKVSNIGASFSLAGADPNYPLYEYDVIATTTTANIIVFLLNAASIGNNTFQYFTATLPNGPFQSTLGPQNMNTIFGSVPVIAAQVFPQTAAADTFNFFVVNAGIYQEGTTTFSGSGFTTTSPGTAVPGLGAAGAGNRLLYYLASGLRYASFNTAGQWVCYQWTATPSPVLLAGIKNRIDAVLTSGDLISTEGGTLRIYDSGGNQITSVPLGPLQFCYEAWVGTTPYVFFSLTLGFPHNNWAFQVYAIPTSELRRLKG
jgi:hypothetical protein